MVIEMRNVGYSINGHEILKNISLCLQKGRFYGVLGPNGAGKSTMIDILCGINRHYSGEVFIEGKDVKLTTPRELSRIISMVPQNFYINFPFSVKEVLMMGRHPHKKTFAPYTPKDYEVVDNIYSAFEFEKFEKTSVMEMSGGEKQRVFFAKALVQETPIIALDEATSNLDIYYTHKLLSVMKQQVLTANKTVISVFHDINTALCYCDDFIFIKDGTVTATGNMAQTMNQENLRGLYNMDFKIITQNHRAVSILPNQEETE
ncbi:MAG: ABC transporter ATP-binding protein [Petrotogaceae bacterium]|jgi:iron complex transport system ATP-binding protein|nr:ABC transporter ATP-binding protein [Petrotogaceae bacterium]